MPAWQQVATSQAFRLLAIQDTFFFQLRTVDLFLMFSNFREHGK